MRYSLRQVECFSALAKSLHFGRAAQQVHMTQPAFSRQIMSIEEATGLKLVNRNSHSVSLTTAGKTFLEGCEKAIIFLEDAHCKAKLVDRGIEGSIKIGHTDLAISSDLPKLIGAFSDHYPKIILDFFMGGTQQILTKLYKKQLDIGFVTGPLEKIDLNYKPVFENGLVVALYDGHPLLKKDKINLIDLRNENFVFCVAKFCKPFLDHIQRILVNSKISPNISNTAVSFTGILSLVAEKKGITIVPDCVKNFHRRGIHFYDISDINDTIPTVAVWSKDNSVPPFKYFYNSMIKVFN